MPFRVQILESPTATLTCPCCQGQPERFDPIPPAYVEECRQRGVEHPLEAWETLNLDSYLCPLCGATDRDRLQVAFLAEYFSRPFAGAVRVLEIAPSPPVSHWLKNCPAAIYRSADLNMAAADDRIDITQMSNYPEGAFDLLICSHVLEHVPDDRKAMREIRRVIGLDGLALFLVPISTLVKDVLEDPDEIDESTRWRKFGQGDHVRIYGRAGFESRLASSGFEVRRYEPSNPAQFGLRPGNTLYVAL